MGRDPEALFALLFEVNSFVSAFFAVLVEVHQSRFSNVDLVESRT